MFLNKIGKPSLYIPACKTRLGCFVSRFDLLSHHSVPSLGMIVWGMISVLTGITTEWVLHLQGSVICTF